MPFGFPCLSVSYEYVTAGSLKHIASTPCCFKLCPLEMLLLLLLFGGGRRAYKQASCLESLLYLRKWETFKRDHF